MRGRPQGGMTDSLSRAVTARPRRGGQLHGYRGGAAPVVFGFFFLVFSVFSPLSIPLLVGLFGWVLLYAGLFVFRHMSNYVDSVCRAVARSC